MPIRFSRMVLRLHIVERSYTVESASARGSLVASKLAGDVVSELIPGLYEQLLTVELQRLLSALEAGRAKVGSPEAADAHVAVAEHLRRIIERALRAVPEAERLTRQAELCNALLVWLREERQSALGPSRRRARRSP